MTSNFCLIHSFSPLSFRHPRLTPNSSSITLPYRRSFHLHVDRRSVVAAGPMFFPENPLVGDTLAMVFSGCFALSILRIYEETASRGVFDQKLNRKLVHTTIGLAFMLCWPLFSSGRQGAAMAALIPGVNIVKVMLIGLGIWKDEATVKSMSRDGDYRFFNSFV